MIDEQVLALMDVASAAKEANEELLTAVKLKSTEEWIAAKRVLAVKIAQEKDKLSRAIMADLSHYTHRQGFILGMEFVIQFIEKELDAAIEARKKAILSRATKLTEEQA